VPEMVSEVEYPHFRRPRRPSAAPFLYENTQFEEAVSRGCVASN